MSPKRPSRQQLIDFLASSRAVQAAVQEQFPSVNSNILADILGANPSSTEETSSLESSELRGELVFVHTDGACRGNPGPSGAGWVFSEPSGQVLRRGKAFLGRATNNEAEYVAVILALEDALKQGFQNLRLHADSELLVKQVTGVYRVKNPRIKELYTQLMGLARKFKSFEAKHVRRELNAEADLEANRAIDGHDQA